MTLNLIEKGIETYNNFNQRQLRGNDLKQSLTQILYILLNSRGKEQLDDAVKQFMRKIEWIIGQIESESASRQNQHHVISIALSLLCIASKQ